MQRVSNTEELPPKVVDEKSLLRQILLRKYGEQPMSNLVAYKTTKARHHQERNGFICTLLLPNIYPDQDFQGKRSATKKDAEKSAAAECLKFMVDEVELTTNSTYDWKAHLNTILMQNLNQSETAARNNIVYQSVKLDESSAVLYVSTITFPQLLSGQEFFGDLSRSKKQAEQSVAQRVGTDPGVMSQVVTACRELCLADRSYGFEPSPPVQDISKLKRYEKYKAICKMRAEKARQKALPKHLRANANAPDAPAEPEVLPPEGQAKYRFKEAHLQWRDLLVSGKIPTKSQLFAYHRALQCNLILVLPRGFGKTLIAAMVMHRMWLSTTFALNALPRLAAAPRHSNLPPVPSAVLARNTSFAVMVVNQVALAYQQRDKLALDTGLRVFAVGSLAEFTALPGKIARTELDFLVITTGFLLQMLHRTIHSPLQLRDVCCLVFYDCLHDPFVESIMHIAQVATWKPRLLAVTTHPAFAPPSNVGDEIGEVDAHAVVGVVQHLRLMLYGAAVYMPSLPPPPEHVRYIVHDTPDSPLSPDSIVMSSDTEDVPRSESSGPGSCHTDDALSPLLSAAPQPDSPFVPPPPPPPPVGPPPALKRLKEVSLLLTLDGYNSDSEAENEVEKEVEGVMCEIFGEEEHNEQVVVEKVEEMVLQDTPSQAAEVVHSQALTTLMFRPPVPAGRPPLPPGPPPCPVLGPPPIPPIPPMPAPLMLVSSGAPHASFFAAPVLVLQAGQQFSFQPRPSVWGGNTSPQFQPHRPPAPVSPLCQYEDQNGMQVVDDGAHSPIGQATHTFVPPPVLTVPRVFSQPSVVTVDAAEGKHSDAESYTASGEGAKDASPPAVPVEPAASAVSAHSSSAGPTSPACLDPPAAVAALLTVLKAQDDGGQGNVLVYFDDPATAHRLLITITQELPLLACTVLEGRHEATLTTATPASADGVLGEIDIDAEVPMTAAEEAASKVRVKRYEATANRAAALSVREKVLLAQKMRQESTEVKGSDGDQDDAHSAAGDEYRPSTTASDTSSPHPGGNNDADEVDEEVESSVADSLYLEDLVHHMDEAVELVSLLGSVPEEDDDQQDAPCVLETVFQELHLPLDALWGTKVVLCTAQALTDGVLLQGASAVSLQLVVRYSGDLSLLHALQDRHQVHKESVFQRAQRTKYVALTTRAELQHQELQKRVDATVRRTFHSC